MKIDIVCRDGSPIGTSEASIFGRDGRIGLGGAELFLFTICRAWHDAGHIVRLYNDPKYPDQSAFGQFPISFFDPKDNRDILIVFRSPNPMVEDSNGLICWLSTDQNTVGDFKSFAHEVDKIVTISKHHAQHFKTFYNIEDTIIIDIPVRTWEYEDQEIEKIPFRCIFNHIPDRGVMELHAAWAQIVQAVPQASLVITSDWRLWDEFSSPEAIREYKVKYSRLPGVSYLGAINRRELIRHQLEAQLSIYPCKYDELFCISIAENQIAGCYPVTSDCGALKTTNMGLVIPGNVQSPAWIEDFVTNVVMLLKDQDALKAKADKVKHKARERFNLDRILKEWDTRVFN